MATGAPSLKGCRNRGLWCALLAGSGLMSAGCTSKSTQAATSRRGEGGVPVTVATVTQKNVPLQIDVIGNVEAYSPITVKAHAGGKLTQVHFREGDDVKAGDLLCTSDPRPLKPVLNQSEANRAKDEAALGQAEANLV